MSNPQGSQATATAFEPGVAGEPAILLSTDWAHLRGSAFGLKFPCLRGGVRIPPEAGPALSRLVEAVRDLTSEEPADPDSVSTAKGRLDALAMAVGALQRQAGVFVPRQHRAVPPRGHGAPDISWLLLPTADPAVTRLAIQRIVAMTNALLRQDESVDPADFLANRLADLIKELAPMADPRINIFMLEQAADALGIPVFKLNREMMVLGTGRYSRWFNSTITDRTPSVGVALAKNKHRTAMLLRSAGLPGGINRLVENLDQAHEAAKVLGFPLVIKPNDQDRGLGVHADLRTPQELEAAFADALLHSRAILVERWVPGSTHRLTVFEGEVVRVVKRVAGGVTGDGRQTVRDLVEEVARSPEYRRRASRTGQAPLSLDAEALSLLARDGLDETHVPPAGLRLRLRRKDNINAGGSNQDYELAQVHPDNLRLAVDAAQLLRLDFAGIDLIIEDIGRSWLETGGLICEINAQPQLRAGGDSSVYESILRKVFANGTHVPADVTLVPDSQPDPADFARKLSLTEPDALVSSRAGLWRAGDHLTHTFEDGQQAAVVALTRLDCQRAHAILGISEVLGHGLPTFVWRRLRFAGFDANAESDRVRLRAVQTMIGAYFSASP